MERTKIRRLLAENNLTSVWLINQLAQRGITVDKCSFSNILAGTRTGPKADAVISASLDILAAYCMTPFAKINE